MRQKKQDTTEEWFASILDTMKAQFGSAVKQYWVHAEMVCPGCGKPIDEFIVNNQRAVSVNGFMYREKEVLIAYFLCEACAKEIFAQSHKYEKTTRHELIEQTLKEAYQRYLAGLNA